MRQTYQRRSLQAEAVAGAETDVLPSATLAEDREESSVGEMIEARVRSCPQQLAVREPGGAATLTYRELWERSGWLAAQLTSSGVQKGDLIALDLPRCAGLVVAILGVVRSGAAYLPLDPLAPAERIAGIIEEAGVRGVIGKPGESRRIQTAGIPLLEIPQGPERTHPVSVPISGTDPICVTYTSGSTGRPKGVMITHRGVARLVRTPDYFTIATGERVANLGNPAFDISTLEIWQTLTAGATIVPFPSFTELGIDEWLTLLQSEHITTMFLTTSLFHTIAWERPDAFGTVRNLLVGGEQLDLVAVRQVLIAGSPGRLVNAYGPSEVTVLASFFACTLESLAGVERVPIGFASQAADLFVLDDDLRLLPSGEVGELCVGGPRLATGYLNRPDLTRERFVREPASGQRIYRTGDLVRQLPGGALEMVGRQDRQIKLRGFRVELEEIERVAMATGLLSAVFVEKAGEGASATLVGFALPAHGRGETGPTEEISRLLSCSLHAQLPDYMLPSRWIVLSELPLTATGKADRTAMRAMLDQEGSRAEEPAALWPADPVSTDFRAILHDILGTPHLTLGTSFVAVGGNSILAMRTAYRVRQCLGFPLQPVDVLQAPSLQDLLDQLHEMARQPV